MAATPLWGPELLAALRAGGYILYFRHADTDHGQNDDRMTSVEDCTTQRNLTNRGRDHARAIGEVIRTLGIPIGAVLASPLCRTVETAVLASAVENAGKVATVKKGAVLVAKGKVGAFYRVEWEKGRTGFASDCRSPALRAVLKKTLR